MNRNLKRLCMAGSICLILTGCAQTQQNETDENITLPEYVGIETGLEIKEATQEEIDNMVDQTVENAGGNYVLAMEKTIDKGDKVVAHMSEGENDFGDIEIVIGDVNYPAEFSDGLKGLKAGDTAVVTTSEGGEAVTYTLVIEEIFAKGDITDDYVKTLGIDNVSTKEELSEMAGGLVLDQHKNDFRYEVEDKVVDMVVEASEVKEIPESLIEDYENIIHKNVELTVSYYKQNGQEVTTEELLKEDMEKDAFDGTAEEYITKCATDNAKRHMILEAIAEKENITVSDAEAYSDMAGAWADNRDQYPTLLDFMGDYGLEQFKRNLIDEKVTTFLTYNSKEGKLLLSQESNADAENVKEETN